MITNPEEVKLAYNRAYNKLNKDRLNAYRRKRYAENSSTSRNQLYKYRYGITLDEYNNMYESQNKVCAICGRDEDKRRLAVDHDHNTGAVRGLLCIKCNTMVGQVESSSDIINNVVSYLKRKVG